MPRKPTDLTGQRFGMLVVTGLSDQRTPNGKHLYYSLVCDCGNVHKATYGDLKRGAVTSCGCKMHLPKADISGQRYGRLVAIKPVGGGKWLWQCDCGHTKVVPVNHVKSGNTLSCGCMVKDKIKTLYVDGTAPCKIKPETRQKLRSTNSSGVTGVWWDKSRALWVAEIMFKNKKYNLGRYPRFEDAVAVRKTAETMIFDEFLDWYYSQFPDKKPKEQPGN